MTPRVAKRPSGNQTSATIGKVSYGAGGIVTMIEFCEYKRDPTAPERLVNKIGGIYRFGGIIKCTFVLESPGPGGIAEAVEKSSLLWETRDVMSANESFNWAFNEISKGNFLPDDGGGRRPRTQ